MCCRGRKRPCLRESWFLWVGGYGQHLVVTVSLLMGMFLASMISCALWFWTTIPVRDGSGALAAFAPRDVGVRLST